MSAGTVEALLQASAQGDVAAFRRLYDIQARPFYGVALRITRQPAQAADAVQEAFLQIWQHAGSFDPDRGSAIGWMLSIVRYRALDIVRRAPPPTDSIDSDDGARLAVENLPSLAALQDEGPHGTALMRCLQALPEERRDLVVAAFVHGFTHQELAARLKQPLGTVKSWIRRSLEGLRVCMQGGAA